MQADFCEMGFESVEQYVNEVKEIERENERRRQEYERRKRIQEQNLRKIEAARAISLEELNEEKLNEKPKISRVDRRTSHLTLIQTLLRIQITVQA